MTTREKLIPLQRMDISCVVSSERANERLQLSVFAIMNVSDVFCY